MPRLPKLTTQEKFQLFKIVDETPRTANGAAFWRDVAKAFNHGKPQRMRRTATALRGVYDASQAKPKPMIATSVVRLCDVSQVCRASGSAASEEEVKWEPLSGEDNYNITMLCSPPPPLQRMSPAPATETETPTIVHQDTRTINPAATSHVERLQDLEIQLTTEKITLQRLAHEHDVYRQSVESSAEQRRKEELHVFDLRMAKARADLLDLQVQQERRRSSLMR